MRAFDVAVFDWVVMDIIHVVGHVALVPNQMFPKSPLPDACFAFVRYARRGRYMESVVFEPLLGKATLDHTPADGKSIVVFWHLPHRV